MQTKNIMEEDAESPVLTVRMSSGELNKQCDLYPHGSYHKIKKDDKGFSWVQGRIDCIPNAYPFQIVKALPNSLAGCPECENIFNPAHPFIEGTCIRCYEKRNFVNREEYREAVRKELRLEGLL